MTLSVVTPGIWKRYVRKGEVSVYLVGFQKTRLDCKQNYNILWCDKFDILDLNNKSNKLENEIAQLKMNKSQKLESSSNVSVKNANEIKKMENSITDINAKLFGKFTSSRTKLAMLKNTGFCLVSMFTLNTQKRSFHFIF